MANHPSHDGVYAPSAANVPVSEEQCASAIRANDAIELVFHHNSQDATDPFHPLYTHQLFPNERIVGYRSFKVRLNYTAGSLFPYLETVVNEVLPPPKEEQSLRGPTSSPTAPPPPPPPPPPLTLPLPPIPTAVEPIITKHLGVNPPMSKAQWEEKLGDELNWKPDFCSSFKNPSTTYHLAPQGTLRSGALMDPAKLSHHSPDDDQFIVLRESLSDSPELRTYHKRLQFLMYLSIDSASYIDDMDERWEIYLLFHNRKSPVSSFSLVGYSTVYPFTVYEKTTKQLRERVRISQFLILPQYRRGGHGDRLLAAIYEEALSPGRDAMEVTIEDPSEGFRGLRDVADLRRCLAAKLLTSDPRNEPIHELSSARVSVIQQKLRITKPQARRCHEINLLRGLADLGGITGVGPAGGGVATGVGAAPGGALGLSPADLERKKKYRLMVKKRVYLEFEEILAPFEPEERKRRLVELYDDLEKEYILVAKKIPLKRKRLL